MNRRCTPDKPDGDDEVYTQRHRDESPEADQRLQRVLTCDPATGVFRHADAGYDKAQQVAKERGVKMPG